MKHDTLKELQRISSSIPQELLDRLSNKESKAKVTNEIVDRALRDPKVPVTVKRRLYDKKQKGQFDVETEEVDREVEEQIDEYVTSEIQRSIRLGRLDNTQFDEYTKDKAEKTRELRQEPAD